MKRKVRNSCIHAAGSLAVVLFIFNFLIALKIADPTKVPTSFWISSLVNLLKTSPSKSSNFESYFANFLLLNHFWTSSLVHSSIRFSGNAKRGKAMRNYFVMIGWQAVNDTISFCTFNDASSIASTTSVAVAVDRLVCGRNHSESTGKHKDE